jgi:glycosyltransferase involved in cell wall biosynthesis
MEGEPTSLDVTVVTPEGGTEDRYAALNDAAAAASSEWILFPPPNGSPGAPGSSAAVAGAARMDADAVAGADGSLLVRRRWFESLGGFHEGILGGGELDLCLRLAAIGRRVEGMPSAGGAAAAWIARRHPGTVPGPGLAARLFGDNRIADRRLLPEPSHEPSLVVLTDAFPARSETFVYREADALRRLGWSVRVESSARPVRAERAAARRGRIDYLEDDPPLRGFADLMRLVARHPLRVLADLRERRRWREEERPWPLRSLASAARRLEAGGERHVHVHFAGLAALHALRLAQITGVTYSVAPHGYDLFARPRNLAAKLGGAAFVAAPSEYTAGQVRELLARERHDAVHVIVMGVDGEEFRRRRPYPGGAKVVAIGRLVEKKGFAHLVDAVARLSADAPERVAIAGDGPLRAELERAIEAASLTDRVEIVDAWGADAVRELLEGADLLAMPCVIAADGDRDAMPVVVKEALAMEVPVVASDAVGLPELVAPEWGRLVPSGDPGALAAAIAELLALSPEQRAEMGAAGRTHVLAHCDVETEAAKLAGLVAAAVDRSRR